MKLSIKLPLAIGLTVALTAIAGLAGIHRLDDAAATYALVIEHDYAQERESAAMLVEFKTQVQEWKDTLLRGKDPAQLQKYWSAFQEHEGKVDQSAQALLAALPPGEARDLTAKFAEAHRTMGVNYRHGMEAFQAAGLDSAAGDAAVKGMDRVPAALLAQVSRKIVETSSQAVRDADTKRQQAIALSLGLMALLCLAGVAGAALLARSVLRDIGGEPRDARDMAGAIASGNLAVDLSLRHGDTTSVLAAMGRMRDSLSQIVAQVRTSSEGVATGSQQIAMGNADLSQRTEEQASNLQQTAASMEELSATVRSNADSTREASDMALKASTAAEKGGAVVANVVATMTGIAERSRQIQDIIGVIDSIAFQTNILALNAAVEAARAGDQGRGFSVVASEVRQLAQRSATAAREIKSLLAESSAGVETGAEHVSDASATMHEIVAHVQKVAEIVGQISAATLEQTAGVEQVSHAVTQLDQVTQQNAALVEESAAAAESLRRQASKLVETVSVFRLAAA